MRPLILALTLAAAAAAPAWADNAAPVVPQVVIEETAGEGTRGYVLPSLLFLFVAVVVLGS
jgi:hypothetical protein